MASALTFTVTAYDEAGVIGKGTHKRAVINVEDRSWPRSEAERRPMKPMSIETVRPVPACKRL